MNFKWGKCGPVVLTAMLGFEALGHELLPEAHQDSAAARWLNKKVISTRVLDDMEEIGRASCGGRV